MKRSIYFALAICMIFLSLTSCSPNILDSGEATNRLRLSDFVGIWTNDQTSLYYRFTPTGLWFSYNQTGEVTGKGDVVFNGTEFHLTADNQSELVFRAEGDKKFFDQNGIPFHPTDSPASLIASKGYEDYFDIWYEDANLNGNLLTIFEPDLWTYEKKDGTKLNNGTFYAFAGEEENLYLFDEDGDYFATISLSTEGILARHASENDRIVITEFRTEENSTLRNIYFKEKDININYFFGEGNRLLRNGGAAFNEAHDYQKMPVNCKIETVSDRLNQNGEREMEIKVTYEFRRSDMPSLSGKIYNTVRFSQYDYYTGKLFYLDDSTGTQQQSASWKTDYDGKEYTINCDFSSRWEYSKNDSALVRFEGIYHLTMSRDYDGFVICLRPVYNSYSSQISASIIPQEGTLLLEDLGTDVDKSIFCKIEKNWEISVVPIPAI